MPNVFLDAEAVRDIQKKVDEEIQEGIAHVYQFHKTKKLSDNKSE